MGHERPGRGNETVHDDRLPPGGRPQHDAGDAAEDAAIEAMPPGIAKATALQKRALARATGH